MSSPRLAFVDGTAFRQPTPGTLSSDDDHDAVDLAMRPLWLLSKLFGVHPSTLQSGCRCGLWVTSAANALLLGVSLALVSIVDATDSSISVEEYTNLMALWAICGCALVNTLAAPTRGTLHAKMKEKWRRLDRRLGVREDLALRRWGRHCVRLFVALQVVFAGTGAAIVFSQRPTTDPVSNLLLSAAVAALVWHNAAVLLPQIQLFFYCRATESRFALLGGAVQRVLGTGDPFGPDDRESEQAWLPDRWVRAPPGGVVGTADVGDGVDVAWELEGLRHTYHLVTELTQDVSALLSPALLLGFLVDSGLVCTSMYHLIQTWDFERWSVPLELATIVVCILKILFCSLLGSTVTQTATDTLQLLPKTSYRNKNFESKYQAQLFALTSADDAASFSASGFFNIDRPLFTATVGTVATYFVVLLQFRKS